MVKSFVMNYLKAFYFLPYIHLKSFVVLIPFFAFLVLTLTRCSQGTREDKSSLENHEMLRVIFDTDVGGDVDDAGALAVLHALADRGEIDILAIGVVIGHELAVPFVHAVNTWYGRPDLPIGTIKGPAPYSRDEFMEAVVAEYPYTLTQDAAPDVVELYRKVLASQPDRSVTLIAVGPATNISNLLNSGPCEYSPLTGVELMRQKIMFYGAGGNGNARLPGGLPGFNYRTDLASASNELELLPSEFPTVFAGGSGYLLYIGSAYNDVRPDHIIRRSYEEWFKGLVKGQSKWDQNEEWFKGLSQGRQSWDQLRVLYACRPSARHLWDTSPEGNIEVDMEERLIIYTPEPNRNRAYAYLNSFEAVRSMLTELMTYDPRDK
jgi:hypothetical protein